MNVIFLLTISNILGVLTVCGHKYCKLCFLHWWQQHHNCPVCKSRLGRHDFHQITYKPQDIVAQEEMPQQPEEETLDHHSAGNAIYSDISSGAMKEIQEIDIDGSFGTKIDTIARHLLWLRENDPGAKSIVFSQYRPFLKTLASAFTRFKIGFTTVDTRDGIEGFKKDASVSTKYPRGIYIFFTLSVLTIVYRRNVSFYMLGLTLPVLIW